MKSFQQLVEERCANGTRNNEEIYAATWSVINEVVQAIFNEMPDVNVMAVQGYTPYFNDGDICEWSIATSVDYYNLDDVYYTPVYHFSKYGDQDEDSLVSKLFNRVQPLLSYPEINRMGWEEKQASELVKRLKSAARLLNTLSHEFKIVDQDNGTWWVFIRTDDGFDMVYDTFDHD